MLGHVSAYGTDLGRIKGAGDFGRIVNGLNATRRVVQNGNESDIDAVIDELSEQPGIPSALLEERYDDLMKTWVEIISKCLGNSMQVLGNTFLVV
ncbi:hypothetical protein KOR42_26690 [Thalassoglobus neptunius]|uniref:Uncharacterized protein n=2 Tax=Thalassoglobus neptunius TaxID=1938619 RepID=A0A5C5X023_9PLAN|nr:hypothetical protein KOR42_26690 [Thalassoglobus neptunius]